VLLPVIMAGGSGTRLWPLSRSQYPKQFLKLVGDQTLLQGTALRAAALPGALPPLAICGDQHRFIVAEQLREANVRGATIILEPQGRNTAPVAAVAAQFAKDKHGPGTLVFLMAADHVIPDQAAFAAAVAKAAAAASAGRIVTFGIKPTRPETGFGYIKAGRALESGGRKQASRKADASGALEIAGFVEKPDLETAQKYLHDGGYWWNAGMFVFRADTMIDEMQRLERATNEAAREAIDKAARDLDFVRLDPEAFGRTRADSIDYAVMEKTASAALVPLDAGWDDVGSWSFLDTQPKDAQGNATRGDVLLEDARGNLVHASSRLVALAGVDDQIVIETADAVLVTTRERAQDVKKIVARLQAGKRVEAEAHPRVYRPWGWYEGIAAADRFQVKRIMVKAGQKLSLQMHHHRAEHWVVVQGTARVTCGDRVFLLHEDQSTYIPLGERHRLENPGKVPLELIEVQSGAYLGEDDIVRFEDIYGRAGAAHPSASKRMPKHKLHKPPAHKEKRPKRRPRRKKKG
jgi:mannose-1-phosphate guanylyltransferase/mannose-6-phosphate isomerase